MTVTSFEVGSVFKLIDEVSPTLKRLSTEIGEFNKLLNTTKKNLAEIGGAKFAGLETSLKALGDQAAAVGTKMDASLRGMVANTDASIASVDRLARSWEAVATATTAAAGAASRASVPAATSAPRASTGIGAASGRGRLSNWLGTSSAHVSGPGVGIPGGGHVRLGGTASMAGAAAIGYGIYEDAQLQKDIHWINYHLGRKDTPQNISQVRKIIEDAMKDTGMPMRDIARAATDEARLLKGTPGESSGIAAMPELLRAAASEALAKDVPMDESMKAIVGLAHQVKAYKPEEIKALFPAFAYLSTANPAGLKEMEKSFSYAVPILQSGADVDPTSTMLLGTALSTAGVTSSKSGTWLREMVTRGMPGNKEHNAALKRFGLIDDQGKPTWFTNGKPDPAKLLEIAGPKAAAMPPEERLPGEMELFGRRGAGAFSVLGDPRVLERVKTLRREMDLEGFQNQYSTILQDYKGTAVGTARTTLAEFNVALMQLGDTALPLATAALKSFSTVLGWFEGGHKTPVDKTFKPNWMENLHDYMPWGGASAIPEQQKQIFDGSKDGSEKGSRDGSKDGSEKGSKEGAKTGVIDGFRSLQNLMGNTGGGVGGDGGGLINAAYHPDGGGVPGFHSGGGYKMMSGAPSITGGSRGTRGIGYAPSIGRGDDPRGLAPYIREMAAKYGIDPDTAIAVAKSEGLGSFSSGIRGETSWGAFQLHTGGGLGDAFRKETGLDPSDPKNEKAAIEWAMKNVGRTGWGPYHGARNRYGLGNWAGIGGHGGGAHIADMVRRGKGGGMGIGGANLAGLNPEFHSRMAALWNAAPDSAKHGAGIISGLRSTELQAQLYQRYRSGRGGIAAPPGHSKHEHGLAADWRDPTGWFHSHAHEYGLTFPLGRRDWPHMQMDPNASRAIPPARQSEIHIHTPVHLDGRKITNNVMKHTTRSMNVASQGSRMPDYSAARPMPV